MKKNIALEDAADIVCMNCVEDTLNDNSCCEKCPVRKTMDYINEKRNARRSVMKEINFSNKEMIGQMIDVVEDYLTEQTGSKEAIITDDDYDKLADKFATLIGNWTPEIIKSITVDEGFLGNWYQDSLADPDAPPVWTDEHISELIGNFYLIAKEAVDGPESEEE